MKTNRLRLFHDALHFAADYYAEYRLASTRDFWCHEGINQFILITETNWIDIITLSLLYSTVSSIDNCDNYQNGRPSGKHAHLQQQQQSMFLPNTQIWSIQNDTKISVWHLKNRFKTRSICMSTMYSDIVYLKYYTWNAIAGGWSLCQWFGAAADANANVTRYDIIMVRMTCHMHHRHHTQPGYSLVVHPHSLYHMRRPQYARRPQKIVASEEIVVQDKSSVLGEVTTAEIHGTLVVSHIVRCGIFRSYASMLV